MKIEWDGKGLPPVGSEAEAFLYGEWRLVKVVYISEPDSYAEALVFDVKTTRPSWADQFRPILTEAERRREASTKAMNNAWRARAGEEDGGVLKSIYEIIYDAIAAGNIPGIRLTDDASD